MLAATTGLAMLPRAAAAQCIITPGNQNVPPRCGDTGVESAALDLSFMAGVLDGRIAFTRAAGPATYFDATGTMQTAGTNVPRFDNDPVTHAPRGLLIEEARTNVLLQSGDFTNAAWSKINSTLSAGIPGPNGAVTGSGFISNAGVIGYVGQVLTPVAGTTYTQSCFVKAGSLSLVTLLIPVTWWADAAVRSASFNLTTVTATPSGAGATAAIIPVGQGWYRISLTVTPDTAVAATPQFVRATSNGDGTTVQYYVFGAQIEAGAFPTSYIPTTAATATRAAEAATIPLGAWFNAVAGSLAVDYTGTNPPPAGAQATVARLDDGTATNLVAIFYLPSSTQGRANVIAATVNQLNTLAIGAANTLTGAINKAAIAYGGGGPWITTMNANVPGVGTGSTVLVSPTTLRLGVSVGGNWQLNGYIRRVRYWPRALSNSELQSVTT